MDDAMLTKGARMVQEVFFPDYPNHDVLNDDECKMFGDDHPEETEIARRIDAALAEARGRIPLHLKASEVCDTCKRPMLQLGPDGALWDADCGVCEARAELAEREAQCAMLREALRGAADRSHVGFCYCSQPMTEPIEKHEASCQTVRRALIDTRDTARAFVERIQAAERERGDRKCLWLHHGCPSQFLYGDDGEMQCANSIHGPLDFKRAPLLELHAAIRNLGPQEGK